MNNQPERTYSLDFVKGIAALLIVCLHCPNTDSIDSFVHVLGRMAVPMFFIITGYFLPLMIQKGRLPGHAKKILGILVGATVLYLLLFVIGHHNQSLSSLFEKIVDWKNLPQRILWGRLPLSMYAGHLWFLVSILYILVMIGLFVKKYPLKNLYVLIPLLFLAGYVISSFDVDNSLRGYYQNYIFIGFPYVLLGSYINGKMKGIQLKNRTLIMLIIFFFLIYAFEIFLYVKLGLPSHREHYLAIIPLVSLILIVAAKNPMIGHRSFITVIGRKYSVYIYVVHFYIVNNMWLFTHQLPFQSKFHMLASVLVSVLISIFYVKAKDGMRSLYQKKS